MVWDSNSKIMGLFSFFSSDASHGKETFPNQGPDPSPLQWKHRVLITGPPGKPNSKIISWILLYWVKSKRIVCEENQVLHCWKRELQKCKGGRLEWTSCCWIRFGGQDGWVDGCGWMIGRWMINRNAHTYIRFLALSACKRIWKKIAAMGTPRTQILASEYLSPIKGTRASWRNDWFTDGCREKTRWTYPNMLCQNQGSETCPEDIRASSPRPDLGQFQRQNSDSNGLLAIDQNKSLWIHPYIDEIKNNK